MFLAGIGWRADSGPKPPIRSCTDRMPDGQTSQRTDTPRYGAEFDRYARRTKKLIPMLY